ncbi:MAG TPA: hypothetical protein VG826_04455 [Pirellulales bacterium]|nr:hypothetical protein [Pirellulales bacterium]
MLKKVVAAGMVLAALVCEAQAEPSSAKVETVAWRGGYRYRRSSYPAANRSADSYGYRRSNGRSSALDYPPSTQPYATRINQWNKYPNQPYYLRGERKSLLILP